MESSLRKAPGAWRVAGAVILALSLAACAGEQQRSGAAASPVRPAVQIVVLGDSLALGTGASDSADGFAFRIYRTIAATHPGSEITNMAIGGSTSADVLRLQTARLRERRFDIVILCVGGNDVVRAVPTTVFTGNYRRLVTAIRRIAPDAALVAIGVPDVSISPLFADHAAAVRQLARADDRAARAAVLAAGMRYVELFALIGRKRDAVGFLSADRFHPSDDGHAQIASAALPAVEAALRGADTHAAIRTKRSRGRTDR